MRINEGGWLGGASLAILAGMLAVPSAAHAQQTRRHLNVEDLYRVIEVSVPEVSPDGKWVAYLATQPDREADESRSAVWMVSWNGEEHVALSTPTASTAKPHWSPDGRYLAFLANPPGAQSPQVMVLDRRGGGARTVSHESGEIVDYAWAPDGQRMVLTVEAGEGSAPRPIVLKALHFKQDGDGYLSAGRVRHLAVLDLDSGRSQPLGADPQWNDESPTWSPDGKHIAFVRTHERGADADGREAIAIIEAPSGSLTQVLTRPFAPNTQRLAFSPDGQSLAFLEGLEPKLNAYIQDRLVVIPAAGGAPRVLSAKLDRAVSSYAFTPDSSGIDILVEDDRTTYAAHIDLKSSNISRESTAAPEVLSSISDGAGHRALLVSRDNALAEVYALENGAVRALTHHNDAWLSRIDFGKVEDFAFKSKDGADIHGLMVKPVGFQAGRKYPTLLWIHGGPNGQDEHALALDGYQFEPQMFAARGFLILRINYRGGSGRGAAFAKAIAADWGHLEVMDLLAGVDHAIQLGIADSERLAIGGWSYGGILTDYSIATDRRFKVAISGAGSANQLATYGSDEYVLQYNNELGPPWKDTALWMKVSYPFFHADRIHTPTLFLGGDKDFNVPLIGGEQMYEALRTLGIPAELVIYPGEHHVFTRPSFVKDLADRMAGWIDQFIPSTAMR